MSTINATSVSYTDVTAAIASAADGDTVSVPAGTAHYTQPLVYSKNISLIGQTGVTRDHTTSLNVNDQTIIIEDVPLSGSSAVLIQATFSSGGRISGFSFHGGTRATTPDYGGVVIRGTST